MRNVGAILFVGSTIFLASCSETAPTRMSEPPTRLTVEQWREKTSEIGLYHTAVMQHVFAAFQAERAKGGPMTGRRACNVLEASLRNFAYMGKMKPDNEILRQSALEIGDCNSDQPFSRTSVRANRLVAPDAPRTDYISESGISPAAQSLVRELTDLADVAGDLEAYLAAVATIEATAASTLNNDEIGLIFQLTSVARESAGYWNYNIDAWWAANGGNPNWCETSVCVATEYDRQIPLNFNRSISIPKWIFGRPKAGSLLVWSNKSA
jgi:hypothetical protein